MKETRLFQIMLNYKNDLMKIACTNLKRFISEPQVLTKTEMIVLTKIQSKSCHLKLMKKLIFSLKSLLAKLPIKLIRLWSVQIKLV